MLFVLLIITLTAIIDLITKLTDAMDQNKFTAGIFLDLSKAFDTGDHSFIIAKLEQYGIQGKLLNGLKII